MLVRSLRLIASVLILNATGGNIRFGLWASSTFSDAQNWPLADQLLTAWAGRNAAAETVEVDYLRFEDVFGDIWSVAAAPFFDCLS